MDEGALRQALDILTLALNAERRVEHAVAPPDDDLVEHLGDAGRVVGAAEPDTDLERRAHGAGFLMTTMISHSSRSTGRDPAHHSSPCAAVD